MSKIISASVTPFDDKGAVDTRSAERLFKWGLEGGLDGFFLGGNMGEWSYLTEEQLETLAGVACEVIGSRARIILGIHDTGLPRIQRKIERLSRFKHTHWAALLPVTAGGIPDPVNYVHRLADSCDRPFYLYYLPSYNGIQLSSAQFEQILRHPNVAGVKNSAGQMRIRKELCLLKDTVPFELLEGEEWAIDEALIMGCDGIIAGFGSMGIRLFRAIDAAVARHDLVRARALQSVAIRIYHAVYGNPPAWSCAGQKYGLMKMGILTHATTLLEAQRALPAERRASIERCIADFPEWFGPAQP
jgi:4-hydroxy-tetrahydrodipicolinate synthase